MEMAYPLTYITNHCFHRREKAKCKSRWIDELNILGKNSVVNQVYQGLKLGLEN